MKRFLLLLKYFLAALSLALIVCWAYSVKYEFGYVHRTLHPNPMVRGYFGFANGTVGYSLYPILKIFPEDFGFQSKRIWRPLDVGQVLGGFAYQRQPWFVASVPICCVLTVLLPLTIGAWCRFRFQLWMYFAWTALIAAQAAYFSAR